MILYFNDYKLIYIITMMGKINNIPVLNEDVIRLVVLNEELGISIHEGLLMWWHWR